MSNILERAGEMKEDLARRVEKLQYLRSVYGRINEMYNDPLAHPNSELRTIAGALSEGIKMALGILGVPSSNGTAFDEDQLGKDVEKILAELQAQFPKEISAL